MPLIASLCGIASAQSAGDGFYNLQSVHGQVKMKGLYRNQYSLIGDVRDDQRSTYFLGGAMLNTGSYLWSPDLVFINLDAEFNPETRNEKYILLPDRSEVRTLKRLDMKASVFRNKPVSLNGFVNLGQSYYNRELLTNVQSDTKQWGALLALNNKFLPVTLSFRRSGWVQNEIQSGRRFSMDQDNLLGRITRSFGQSDRHEIIFSRDDYTYNYAGSEEVKNLIDRVGINNSLFFDKEKKYAFNSQAAYYSQRGHNEFKRVEAIERLIFKLPANLRFTEGYTFQLFSDPFQHNVQNRISAALNHRLFESLISDLSVDYSGTENTFYSEDNLRAGIDLLYTKKIPSGRINLTYRYTRTWYNLAGISAPVRIINEQQTLSDGETTLLNKPYVDLATIEIKDQAGIIIYEAGFDYTVLVRNNYTEIQRVPGGRIANDQAILADYTAIQPGSGSFEAGAGSYSAGILLFNNLLELYYRGSNQDYHNLTETDYMTLNYYNQKIVGGRIDLGFGGFGAEYDSYESNIIPYRRVRYFVDLNWSPGSVLLIGLNGNIMNYKLIDDDVNQQHANITFKMAYKISTRTRLDFEAGYLGQKGRNIDLELLTSKLGISGTFRQLLLKGGVEMYRRHYLKSTINFTGTYIEIIRKF